MSMLFLVCAVALLVHPAVVSCDLHKSDVLRHLNLLYDLAEQCDASVTGGFFVEDVSHLTRGRNKSEDKFFCKVQDILTTPKHFCERNASERLVGNLKMYNTLRNVNCTEALQGVTSTGNEISVSGLLKHLMHCIRRRIFRGIYKLLTTTQT